LSSLLKYKDRKNTDCEKWDALGDLFGDPDLLAMWVADMDFEVPECVKQAALHYAGQGIYGYYKVPEAYYDSFIRWEKTYHNYEVKKDWIRYAPGVVPAIYQLVRVLTEENDHVIFMPPVYPPFFSAVRDNQRKLVECPLVNQSGQYTMDLELFEKLIIENDVKLFILCSPHNPVGRVWSLKELTEVLNICKKHHVYVIADEIHQDLILSGNQQITAATTGSYDDILVTLTSATKTFNIAGCQNSFMIIPDENLRRSLEKITRTMHTNEGNAFGYAVVRSAYEGGREWLEELLRQVEENYQILSSKLKERLPEAVLSPLEGTYLAWIDLSAYVNPEDVREKVQNQAKLAVNYGKMFGGAAYQNFIRLNLATRSENVETAVERLIEAVKVIK